MTTTIPDLAPCCRCKSDRVRGWISLASRGGTLTKSYQINCEKCRLSSVVYAGRDLAECRRLAEHYWNCTLPRLRIDAVEKELGNVMPHKKEKTLGIQESLPF